MVAGRHSFHSSFPTQTSSKHSTRCEKFLVLVDEKAEVPNSESLKPEDASQRQKSPNEPQSMTSDSPLKTHFHQILTPDSESTGSKTPRVKAKLKGRGGEEVKSPSLEEAARRALSWAQIMAGGMKGKWRSGLRGGVARGGRGFEFHVVFHVLPVLADACNVCLMS